MVYIVTYKDYSFSGDLCINPTIILIQNPYYPDHQIRIPKLVANILSFAKNYKINPYAFQKFNWATLPEAKVTCKIK